MPMLMLVSCTAFTTPTTTSATMDIPGMCLDARGVKLKLPLMLRLMLDCIGITTLTLTTATMDSPDMCLDARGEAEAAPDAEADAGLYRYHYPYFNYGYYGFPRYVFGRKRRDAEAAPEADADAGYHGYYPHYGYGRYYGHYFG